MRTYLFGTFDGRYIGKLGRTTRDLDVRRKELQTAEASDLILLAWCDKDVEKEAKDALSAEKTSTRRNCETFDFLARPMGMWMEILEMGMIPTARGKVWFDGA